MNKPRTNVRGLRPLVPFRWWVIVIALALMAAVWWYFDRQIAAIH